MARKTKRQQAQIVEVFYGINPKTFKVESVSYTAGGMLEKFSEDMVFSNHAVIAGRNPRHEVAIVWGLREVISFPVVLSESESAKKKIAELEEKAAKMKKEATEKKEQGTTEDSSEA